MSMDMKKPSKTKEISEIVKLMPFFSLQNLQTLEIPPYYLKIVLSRLKSRGEIVSLKRGVYVSSYFLNEIRRKNIWNEYTEFLSGILYSPSYLSLEYVLNEYNVLSEVSFGFSAMSLKKTARFENSLGIFHYHNVKKELFCGFDVKEENGLFIYKATLAKALFDFLYLRKNTIISKDFFMSLRLNVEQISKNDLKEFGSYVELEGSKKMHEIFKFLQEV